MSHVDMNICVRKKFKLMIFFYFIKIFMNRIGLSWTKFQSILNLYSLEKHFLKSFSVSFV